MKSLAIVVALMVATSLGFAVGTRVGQNEFELADAQYKASILAYRLKALRSGKAERIIEESEILLDGELANHGRYLESHLNWLWPSLRSTEESAIRHAVAHRLSNPYTGPDLSQPRSWKEGVDMNDEFVKGVIEGQRINRQYIDKVLRHYGGTAHNNPLQPTPKSRAAERER